MQYKGFFSRYIQATLRVTQGSILGFLLFVVVSSLRNNVLVYVNDLKTYCSSSAGPLWSIGLVPMDFILISAKLRPLLERSCCVKRNVLDLKASGLRL